MSSQFNKSAFLFYLALELVLIEFQLPTVIHKKNQTSEKYEQ